jgi:hypothetical protein
MAVNSHATHGRTPGTMTRHPGAGGAVIPTPLGTLSTLHGGSPRKYAGRCEHVTPPPAAHPAPGHDCPCLLPSPRWWSHVAHHPVHCLREIAIIYIAGRATSWVQPRSESTLKIMEASRLLLRITNRLALHQFSEPRNF